MAAFIFGYAVYLLCISLCGCVFLLNLRRKICLSESSKLGHVAMIAEWGLLWIFINCVCVCVQVRCAGRTLTRTCMLEQRWSDRVRTRTPGTSSTRWRATNCEWTEPCRTRDMTSMYLCYYARCLRHSAFTVKLQGFSVCVPPFVVCKYQTG